MNFHMENLQQNIIIIIICTLTNSQLAMQVVYTMLINRGTIII